MDSFGNQQRCSMPTIYFAVIILSIWVVTVMLYRLYLHPLARFPGPKSVAISYWQEFYHDVVKAGGGHYYKRVDQMHERYGKYCGDIGSLGYIS